MVLLAAGLASAAALAGLTPVAEERGSLQDASPEDLSPRADTLDVDDAGVDARVAVVLVTRRPGWLRDLATVTSYLAKVWVVVPLVVVAGAVVWRRTGRGSVFWIPLLAVGGGLALSVAVKFIVFRPRPPVEVSEVAAFGPSFPSGHVIRAVAAYGALAWLLAAMTSSRRRQVLVWGAAGLLVAVVGGARVVEGAHWLTDVVASLALGAGWLTVVLLASGLRPWAAAPGRPPAAGDPQAPDPTPPVSRRPTPAGGTPVRRTILGLLVGLGALVTISSALAVLVGAVAPNLAVTGMDADVTAFLLANRAPWLTTVSRAASWLGSLPAVGALVLVLGVAAGVRSGSWRLLWIPSLAGAGALVISVAVKAITARGRPPLTAALVDAHGMAFPSGHALRSVAVHGALAWLLAAAARRRATRVVTGVCAAVLVTAVGFARIYLGAHWLTDVLAGYVLGAAWLGLVLVLVTPRAARQRPAGPGASPADAAVSER